MQRIDAVQPDRRGRETEGEAAAAGGDAADEGADPQEGERVERKSENHRSAQVEREDKSDREHRGEADGERGQRFFAEVEEFDRPARAGPASCACASATTMPHSSKATSGWRVSARNESSALAPLSAVASARKCSGRKIASAMPDSAVQHCCNEAALFVRGADHEA